MENKDLPDLDTYPEFLNSQKDGLPISALDWKLTPRSIRAVLMLFYSQARRLIGTVEEQEALIEKLKLRVEHLEALLGKDSNNSDKPPSSDSPFKRRVEKKRRKRPGARKGHR